MKNVVFIVNIKNPQNISRSDPYMHSINSWNHWCKKHGYELVTLEQEVYSFDVMNPNWHKLLVFDLLENSGIDYDKILIVDADTIVHPDAPNILDTVGEKYTVVRNYGSMSWVCRSYENYKEVLFPEVEYSPLDYFNSGFIILNKSHKEFYRKTLEFYLDNYIKVKNVQSQFGVGTDQPVLNFMSRKLGVEIEFLGYEWNMQDMPRFEILNEDFTFTKCGWVYHFNCIPDSKKNVPDLMAKTYSQLYG